MEPLVFKQLLNDNGLEFTASHCGQALLEKQNWDKSMTWWKECIEAHAKAGVKYMVQPFMDKKGYGSLRIYSVTAIILIPLVSCAIKRVFALATTTTIKSSKSWMALFAMIICWKTPILRKSCFNWIFIG
jgi:hypothetical protein